LDIPGVRVTPAPISNPVEVKVNIYTISVWYLAAFLFAVFSSLLAKVFAARNYRDSCFALLRALNSDSNSNLGQVFLNEYVRFKLTALNMELAAEICLYFVFLGMLLFVIVYLRTL